MKAIDLFCGIGGNSLGARDAGVDIVAGFDIWEQAADVYRANFPDSRCYVGDLGRYSSADIARLKDDIGDIDLILASPPCTGHSPARGSAPGDPASLRLAWQVWRFARVFRPRWMVIENVPQMRNWPQYAQFLHALMKEGYYLREQILDSAQFGVAQRRKRLFILCGHAAAPKEVLPTHHTPAPARSIINHAHPTRPLAGHATRTLERAAHAISALGTPCIMVYYGSGPQWQSLDAPLRTVTTRDHFALITQDNRMRLLQPDELHKAMGFPPHFHMTATRRLKVNLLGNAVCPPVVAAIVKTLIRGGTHE